LVSNAGIDDFGHRPPQCEAVFLARWGEHHGTTINAVNRIAGDEILHAMAVIIDVLPFGDMVFLQCIDKRRELFFLFLG